MIVPPTANSDCRNSTNPVCGPLRYDPPLTNAPAEMEVAMSPPRPKPGLAVTFTIHITDPDSYLSTGDNYCGENDFGDDNRSLCIADCAGPRERYGPWTPPPAEAGDETYTVRHTYTKVGTYTAKFSTIAGMCSERPSQVSSSVTVDVWP